MSQNKSPLPLTDPRDAVPQAHRVVTDVDGQCDKLVTETVTSLSHWPTVTVHLSWQHMRPSAVLVISLVPTKILMLYIT